MTRNGLSNNDVISTEFYCCNQSIAYTFRLRTLSNDLNFQMYYFKTFVDTQNKLCKQRCLVQLAKSNDLHLQQKLGTSCLFSL